VDKFHKYAVDLKEIIMKQPISSRLTFIYKFVLPAFLIGGFTLGMILFTMNAGSLKPVIPMLVFLAVISFILYRLCMRLKKVEMDNECLYMSNYLREIQVRRDAIEKVTENRLLNTHPVTVYFKAPTDFGNSIVFMPRVKPFLFFASHPIVAELKSTIRGAGALR